MGRFGSVALAGVAATVLGACGGEGGAGGEGLSGELRMDGSSTVFPVAEAVAEEFQIENPGVRVTAAYSGTGGGFKRFCAGEIDVSNASRPISEGERETCERNGVEFVELPVARDGLSVIANPQNDFLQCLTVEELRRIWEPNSEVTNWSDVRPEWPDEEIQLYGPGTDSGTFDYFTETVVGEGGASRPDYQASEDDNVLVQGVSGDPFALGYLGYAYVVENRDRLKLVGVDGGGGCVTPSEETIASGEYAPLSRPLFVYVSRAGLQRPEVRAFVEYMMENAPELVPPTGYLPMGDGEYRQNLERIGTGAPAAADTTASEG